MSVVRVERDGAVLRVTLARPERRNAFDAALIAELAEAFADVGDARVVVLAGEGQSFCAGADVEWQRSSIELSYEENVEDYRRLSQMLDAVWRCPAPVVGRIQGYALGGGSGLTCCTDIAIAGAGCRVRLLGGAARDHPGGDLADGAGPDRPGRRAALRRHRRADRRRRRRCGSASSTRSRRTSTRRSSGSSRDILAGGPDRRPRGEAAGARAAAARTTCSRAPPSGARATRGRTASAHSSRSARPAGRSRPARQSAGADAETAGREPRRDRGSHLPNVPRAGNRDRRRRRARRRGRAAHARRRRDGRDRVLPPLGGAHPRREVGRRGRDPSRLRIPRGERGLRRGGRGGRARLRRARAGGAARRRRQARREAGGAARPACRCSPRATRPSSASRCS